MLGWIVCRQEHVWMICLHAHGYMCGWHRYTYTAYKYVTHPRGAFDNSRLKMTSTHAPCSTCPCLSCVRSNTQLYTLYAADNSSTNHLPPQDIIVNLTPRLKCWWWWCFQTNCQVWYLLCESTAMMCVDQTRNRPNQWVSATQSGQSMEMTAEVAQRQEWWESKAVKSQHKYRLTEISRIH